MNIGQLKAYLEQFPVDRVCRYGFGKPHSYRGYYEEVSFPPMDNVTVGNMLNYIDWALSETFAGWKGGEYNYDLNTPVHFCFPGYSEIEGMEDTGVNILLSIAGGD